jgi:hypothetical protein
MWDWNGSRWWRVDFHAHSPASEDYGRGPNRVRLAAVSPRDWLLDFMAAGVDCVVIADHNDGAWVDLVAGALDELRNERPDGYRDLWLFPGTELSVNGGIHMLAVFASGRRSADIDGLLGAVGFTGTKGTSDSVTARSFADVVRTVSELGAIAIPAHVDGPNGLFRVLAGESLAQALELPHLVAMEVADHPFVSPPQYATSGTRWTEVAGSDSHHPGGAAGQNFPGSKFTWVKMGSPSLEGIRLALLDGPLSVRRSDDQVGDPNSHAELIVESIEVDDARYMGRAATFVLRLNPWLNAIVGGRGTGKSTIVEFVRQALRRADEIPDDLRADFDKYRATYPHRDDPGLLTDQTVVRVVYRKDGTRYRIQWAPGLDIPEIEEADGTGWRVVEGDIAQRFPVRMYSQKQIFQLAGTPLSLLRVIDESQVVDRHGWEQDWRERQGHFLALRARARELEAGLVEEPRLRGELDDVRQKLDVFEKSNHAEVLKAFDTRGRQQRMVDAWETRWATVGEVLRATAQSLDLRALRDVEGAADVLGDDDFLRIADSPIAELDRIRASILELAAEADQVLTAWLEVRSGTPLTAAASSARADYEALVQKLVEEGAGDVAAYGTLVLRRGQIEERLEELQGQRAQAAELRQQAEHELTEMLDARRQLTDRRRAFLGEVLRDNRYVRITVVPYGAAETVEDEYRALIQRNDAAFDRDISPDGEGILAGLYDDHTAQAIEAALTTIKSQTQAIASGDLSTGDLKDARFGSHLSRLPPEALDRLEAWYPEDSLEVQYSATSDGARFRAIEEASPGQKTAALLAFLLSYGEEPLFLDQPEDDLDNRLIYDLIVTQIREAKVHRQVVLVTHNANVVVNGDAELVAALIARGGETQLDCQGSLQELRVRDTICDIMEGGRDAFEQRYRRISLALRT